MELPSQMNEEFAYHPAVLRRSSRHIRTGEPIPYALIAKLRGARVHMVASALLRQLYFSVTDLALHSAGGLAASNASSSHACGFDPFVVQRGVASSGYTTMPPLPEDRFLCSFDHIMSGGYAAGYFSYKWAEVLAADAFAAFEEAGLTAERASDDALRQPSVREVGRRYRETVLAMGGAQHPSEVFRSFRGRDPQIGPLLKSCGL